MIKEENKIAKKKYSKFHVNLSESGKLNRTFEGRIYDSEMEMKFMRDVVSIGFKDGTIKDCKLQVKYELQPKCLYKNEKILPVNYFADFILTYADDSVIVWDVKGLADSTAKLKKKMFHYRYPEIDYRWIALSVIDGGWIEYRELEKLRAKRKKEKR